ncbi:unnamed protein product [Echinostoma caproni]|uniref:Mediator of RNA polymerase II transcription subunit 30 n=1 Tax=Echinostoma caproni TaxID=27848 RepID=A0A183AV21_9TREM|nr:unnamed protein product [Echinostoma caproni]
MDRKLQKLKVVIQEQAMEAKSVQEAANKLAGAVGSLANQAELAMGPNRNVVMKGTPEPFCRSTQQRVRELRQRVVDLLRLVGIPAHALVKRVLRLGRWKNEDDNGLANGRPARGA